jgi:hypothetical protein
VDSKVHQYGTPDVKPDASIYRHSSGTARSNNDAGGAMPQKEWSPHPVGGRDEKR